MTEMQALIWAILNLICNTDEETLKKWIYEKWPHGIGLYD